MIKVNISTQSVSREAIPANLQGLDTYTLNNLQTELNPVPDSLTNIEYWSESPQTTVFDEYTQKLGNEILTIDVPNKVVKVSHEVVNLSVEEIASNLSNAKDSAKDKATAKRYEVETGGLTMPDTTVISTDRASQAMISGAFNNVSRNPTKILDWKAADDWVAINKSQLDAIADAVGNHVQAAFSNERAHHEAIDLLATKQEVIDYDFSTGWS